MEQRKFGAIASPQDDRDIHVNDLMEAAGITKKTYPKNYSWGYHGKVKDQGDVNSCEAHVLAYCREIIEEKQSGSFTEFSPGFFYANRKPGDYQGEGMILRQGLNNNLKFGAVPFIVFPWNEEYPKILRHYTYAKLLLQAKAAPYKITAYGRIYTEADYIAAICDLGPSDMCIPIYESFFDTKSDGLVPIPNVKKEKLLGLHAVTGLGYLSEGLTNVKDCLNSWGPNWGNGGKFYLQPNYPITEMWSITDKLLPKGTIKK